MATSSAPSSAAAGLTSSAAAGLTSSAPSSAAAGLTSSSAPSSAAGVLTSSAPSSAAGVLTSSAPSSAAAGLPQAGAQFMVQTYLLTSPGAKLLVPTGYEGERALLNQEHHEFRTAGSLKSKVDGDPVDWVKPIVGYALLSNGEVFCTTYGEHGRFHGGCVVVKTSSYSSDIRHGRGYNLDYDAFASERQIKKPAFEVATGLSLNRFEMHGEVWSRRRLTLPDDDTYSLIQWMDTKAADLKKKPVATKLSDIVSHLESTDESIKSLKKDVQEMKQLLANYSTLVDTTASLADSIKKMLNDQAANAVLVEKVSKLLNDHGAN
ncbi:hypothetical protein ACP70R_006418 [Stipagrostis hirtigluma subsp. patula]